MWCPAYLAGKCKHSDEDCPLPHITAEARAMIQAKIKKNIAAGNNKQ